MEEAYFEKRKSGMTSIGDVAWGTSVCHFYETQTDQVSIIIDFFKAGLENNESCIWVYSGNVFKIIHNALEKALPDLQQYLDNRQIEILSQSQWYARNKKHADIILSKLDDTVFSGFDGLRLAISPLVEDGVGIASQILDEIDTISRYNIVAVFSYPRNHFDAAGLMEAIKNFSFSLAHNGDKCEVIESSEAKITKRALVRNEEKLRSLFDHMGEGFAHHRIILDKNGKPCDYVFLEINDAFEGLVGLRAKDIIGKRVTKVLPGIEKDPTDWIGIYGKVALTGEPQRFDSYSKVLGKWYSVSAFSTQKGFFTVTFTDITARKNAEEILRENEEMLHFALETSLIGAWDLDLFDHTALRSIEHDRIFGYSKLLPQWTYEMFLEHVIPDDRSAVDAKFQHAVRTCGDWNFECRIRRVDGAIRWIWAAGRHKIDSSGATRRMAGIFQDITERKMIEDALKESEQRFKALSDTSPVGVGLTSADGILQYTNLSYEHILGYNHSELKGMKASDLWWNPEERHTLLRTVTEIGVARDVELRLKRKDGTPVWVSINASPITYGGQQALMGTIEDITKRKIAEEALRTISEREKILADATSLLLTNEAPEAVVQTIASKVMTHLNCDVYFNFLINNGRLKLNAYAGIPPETALSIEWLNMGEAICGCVAQDGRRIVSEDVQRNGDIRASLVRSFGVQAYASHPLLSGDNTIGTLSFGTRSRTSFSEDELEFMKAVTDRISVAMRRKQAEENLREALGYLDNLFNYANAPIIVWDTDLRITRFNHAFERLTGRTSEEVLGKSLDILFPSNSRERSMELVKNAGLDQRMETTEIPIQHKDGPVSIVLWNSATLYTADGKKPVATIAQGQDITKRKKAEEDLRRSNAELEVSNKELEAFSYSVSHDLRAPLRSMEGFSSALIEDYADKLDEKGKQYLKYVQDASDLMGRLIDDLLKLSRVTRSEMNYETVNLSEIALNIITELERMEPGRKARVIIRPEITGYGDRNLLRLVLDNLLGNAWKFTGKTDLPEIEFGLTDYKGTPAFFVRDNGVGFDMAYAGKLFQPFQRLHKASEFPGTGIGLATVQRIIRRHGGVIWAESKIGEGAIFYFTLG